MIGKKDTTSQLDFLLLEEVSDEAAEAISGGQELVLGGTQELSLGLFDPITLPLDVMTQVIGSLTALTSALGFTLPTFGDLAGAASPLLGSLPNIGGLLPTLPSGDS